MTLVTFPVKAAAPKSEPVTYLGFADTNKILRKHLAKVFPGVKFRVAGHTYSGGSSTNVTWTDGPTVKQVDAVVSAYASSGFDSSIDLSYSKKAWLLPTGEIVTGYSAGTEGAAGTIEGYAIPKPHPDAIAVSTGVGYVHTRRTESAEFLGLVAAAIARMPAADVTAPLNQGPRWPENEVARLATMIPAPKAA